MDSLYTTARVTTSMSTYTNMRLSAIPVGLTLGCAVADILFNDPETFGDMKISTVGVAVASMLLTTLEQQSSLSTSSAVAGTLTIYGLFVLLPCAGAWICRKLFNQWWHRR